MLGSLKGQATGALKGAAGKGMKDPARRKYILYCIFALLAGAVAGMSALIAIEDPQQAYLVLMISFLLLGVIHVWCMYSNFDWAGKNDLSAELLFSIMISFFMLAGFIATSYFLTRNFMPLFTGSMMLFFVPLLLHRAFIYASVIPEKDYKKWLYPDKPVIADMDNIDLSNFAIITFIFSKKDGDHARSNFQSKAPYPIRLGDLFYFFIQEWNHKNPGSTIQYLDENNRTFGWYFYTRKSWWRPKKYLDADHTIRENKIGVNEIIVTERVNL